ncbi:putative UDP-glucuronate 4-epimerase [Helianthus annuus]|uniref:UDP-glucuronate 4-epimerase n=1 Tax=Helianthus annuus TaxID=4232 RepID=A0A9K3HE77_HELAN|nr:putative UDP-glucuronate 4-epimerase [Helianthus annuus]
MQCRNPKSFTHSNVVGFAIVLEVCKNANPQHAIVWASSSSVYGLNTEVPFSEEDRTDPIRCNEEAGEEIVHTYNHIYGLSLTGLRFFTVYGQWGALDTAEKSTGSGGRKKGVAQFRIFNLGNTSPVLSV